MSSEHIVGEEYLEQLANRMADLRRRIERIGFHLTVVEPLNRGQGRIPSATTVARRQKAMRVI